MQFFLKIFKFTYLYFLKYYPLIQNKKIKLMEIFKFKNSVRKY